MSHRRSVSQDADLLPPELQQQLARALEPAEISAAQREQLRLRVLQRARDQAPEGTVTLRADDAEWTEIAPCVRLRRLHLDTVVGTHTALLRMQPGGVIPAHRHGKQEEFIVLEGECHIGSHKLSAGDAHIAAAGSWHEAVTTQVGVLVLLRGEYPHPAPAHS